MSANRTVPPGLVERAHAGAAIIDALDPPTRGAGGGTRRAARVNALGADLFGDGRLAGMVTCGTCGCLGQPGDDCGRPPVGHRLAR